MICCLQEFEQRNLLDCLNVVEIHTICPEIKKRRRYAMIYGNVCERKTH